MLAVLSKYIKNYKYNMKVLHNYSVHRKRKPLNSKIPAVRAREAHSYSEAHCCKLNNVGCEQSYDVNSTCTNTLYMCLLRPYSFIL